MDITITEENVAKYYRVVGDSDPRPRLGKIVPIRVSEGGANFQYCDGSFGNVDEDDLIPVRDRCDGDSDTFQALAAALKGQTEAGGVPVYDFDRNYLGSVENILPVQGGSEYQMGVDFSDPNAYERFVRSQKYNEPIVYFDVVQNDGLSEILVFESMGEREEEG